MQNATKFKRNYFNFKHKLKSGEIRDVEVYATPITVNNRNILFFKAVFHKILFCRVGNCYDLHISLQPQI
jgi:hypothetical protein